MSATPASPTYGDLTVDDVFASIRGTALAAWSNTTKRVRMAGGLLAFL